MNRLVRGLLLSVAAGVALYLGFAVWSGWQQVGARLGGFAGGAAAGALALAAGNYLVRFAKWQYFLGRLGVRLPWGRSLGIFLAGFSLTVTPGKVGEVLKSYLLRQTDGIPMVRSAPIVVAERVTDLVACLALVVVGMQGLGSSRGVAGLMITGALLVGALVVGVAVRPLGEAVIALVGRLPVVGKAAPRLREFYEASRAVLGAGPLLVTSALSVVAWLAECLAFWLVLRGFPGVVVDASLATFIYAAMTVAGALSFLPGGLLVQEGGMVALLVATSPLLDEPTATAATIITRLCTLWFAVLVGVVALVVVGRRIDLRELRAARASASG